MSSIKVSHITFEHHPTGFGIGHSRPRISWRFSADDQVRGWLQSSYEIQISRRDPTNSKSFKVEDSNSVLVPWPDHELASGESARIAVRAHGKTTDGTGHGEPLSTEWSQAVTVEAALLHAGDWDAKLITSSLAPDTSKAMPPMLFRKTFVEPAESGKVTRARLYITAHGVYEAKMNGKRIGTEEMAPGWTSYNHRLLYQTFDVTDLLSASRSNVLGVEVGEGWFAGRLGWKWERGFYGERTGFLAQLHIEFDSGEKQLIVSDGSWKSQPSATIRAEIYDGEDYDVRQEETGWNSSASFDDSAWISTEELALPNARLQASDVPPVRMKEAIAPVSIFKSGSGKTLIDFGQNLVGKLRVQLPFPPAAEGKDGHKLEFLHAEVLEHNELGTRPLRTAKAYDSIILSANQPSTWEPKFTFHGFRYVQVDGWPTEDGLPSQDDIVALVLHSDMKRTGWFSCSDPLITKLHDNAIWSMKGNFLSLPTDCPQRDERLGWTGDIQVFTPSASFMFDTSGFLGGWLEDVSAEQLVEGRNGIPGVVVPEVVDLALGPQSIWHDVTVLTPWDLYTSTGDEVILRRQYASMKAWVDQGIKRGANSLWDQNVWQFGDWLDPAAPPEEPANGRTDAILVADAYLFHVLNTLSAVSALLGEKKDASRYSEDAARVKEAFQQEYLTPSGLLAGDTQTGYALAICFGLIDDRTKLAKAADRLGHLVQAAQYRIATGFAGTPLITHALSDTGNHQLAYGMLLEKKCPSWLYPITMGATTIWERWDSMLPDGTINPGEMTSFNHYALGSVANWLHKNLAGISPLTPGWRTIKVRPIPGGTITSATAAHESPYGRVECSWEIDQTRNVFCMTIVVPPNSEALVILPSEWSDHEIQEKGMWYGSGKHQMSCPYKPLPWPPAAKLGRSTFHLGA